MFIIKNILLLPLIINIFLINIFLINTKIILILEKKLLFYRFNENKLSKNIFEIKKFL